METVYFGWDKRVWHEIGNANPKDYLKNPNKYRDGHPPHAWENQRFDFASYRFMLDISPYHSSFLIEDDNVDVLVEQDKNFIYPIGTSISPAYWLGKTEYYSDALFTHIPENVKSHIRKGKVIITIDMSFEGFPIIQYDPDGKKFNVMEEIHKQLEIQKFPVGNCVFFSENHLNKIEYDKWCKLHHVTNKIKVITSYHMIEFVKEYAMGLSGETSKVVNNFTFGEVFEYKKKNLENMKHYLNLTRRDRDIRLFLGVALNARNLLDKGVNSMCVSEGIVATEEDHHTNIEDKEEVKRRILGKSWDFYQNKFTHKYYNPDNLKDYMNKLPMYADTTNLGDNLSMIFNEKLYDDTFCSVITETMYFEKESIFLSEKTFKSVAYYHPFIMVSTPFTLKRFRDLGFRTFEGLFDEGYDTITDDFLRASKIVDCIDGVCGLTVNQLLDVYWSQQEVLIHNYEHMKTTTRMIKSMTKLHDLYKGLGK